MARAYLDLCDLCKKPLEGEYPGQGKIVGNPKQGLAVVVGYSDGGWGRRRNHINFSGEVCKPCYETVMQQAQLLRATLDNLKHGDQTEGIKLLNP